MNENHTASSRSKSKSLKNVRGDALGETEPHDVSFLVCAVACRSFDRDDPQIYSNFTEV